jgi:hypothetical protein
MICVAVWIHPGYFCLDKVQWCACRLPVASEATQLSTCVELSLARIVVSQAHKPKAVEIRFVLALNQLSTRDRLFPILAAQLAVLEGFRLEALSR